MCEDDGVAGEILASVENTSDLVLANRSLDCKRARKRKYCRADIDRYIRPIENNRF